MNIHKKIYIFLLRCRLCQLDAAVDLRFASSNTWPSAQVPSLGVVAKISARFSMPSARKCQIRKFICLPIGEYACHNTMPPRHFSHVPDRTLVHKRNGKAGGGGAVRRAKYEKYEKKAKNAKKCCAMMSKTRPSSSSMGATPPQRRAERVEHSQQHVRRGAEQPRGGARNAWGRKGERDGGRRSRGDEEENFFKSRPGSQKSRFSLPLQPESNCTVHTFGAEIGPAPEVQVMDVMDVIHFV